MNGPFGCATLFLTPFALVGLGVLGAGLWQARLSTRAANWPTVPGTITHLSVAEHDDSDGSTYEVKVRYAYTVDGIAYEGDRLAFGYGNSGDRAAHDEIHRKLSEAKGVTVRHDPADPAVSCLSYGLHRSIVITIAFSVVWLGFVFGVVFISWLASSSDAVLLDNLVVQ